METLGLLVYFSCLLLSIKQILMSIIKSTHVFSHYLMYVFELFLHPLCVFCSIRILELLFLLFDCPIKFYEVMTSLNTLKSGPQIISPQRALSLIKKWVYYILKEGVSQFKGIALLYDNCKYYEWTDPIINSKLSVLYLLHRSRLLFSISGDFFMISFNFNFNIL